MAFIQLGSGITHSVKQSAVVQYKFDADDFLPNLKTQLLILQPTPFCNIDCAYCYLPNRNSTDRMTIETIRTAVKHLLDDNLLGESLTVVWHAGEPLSMLISFYENAIEAIHSVLGEHSSISHSIQTNATLINDSWCKFFKRYLIRVGVSIDGPSHIHNKYRHTRQGRPTHHLVMRGIECLKKHKIPFHAITVVTDATLSSPEAFFDFFLAHDIMDVSYNFDEIEGLHTTSSLVGREEAYTAFLERSLESIQAQNGRMQIRELTAAGQLIGAGLPTYRWQDFTLPTNAQVIPFAMIQ